MIDMSWHWAMKDLKSDEGIGAINGRITALYFDYLLLKALNTKVYKKKLKILRSKRSR